MTPRAARPDVVFVAMPFAEVLTPSVAVGLLQAILRGDGVRTCAEYGNLLYAGHLGARAHDRASARRGYHIGDWLFGSVMFPGRVAEPAVAARGVLGDVAGRDPLRVTRLERDLREWREQTDGFLDSMTDRVLAHGARVVACSATYLQLYPSLALLQRVRERAPDVVTLLGGPGCEAGMGLAVHRLFPWVDYLVSGEADDLIVPLVRRLLEEGRSCPTATLPVGVVGPDHRTAPPSARLRAESFLARARSQEGHPTPDYDEYFATLAELPALHSAVTPGLPVEGSRGCWRAERRPCFFCGDNGARAEFRPRPPAEFLRDLDVLHARHGITRFVATDNMMDLAYVQGVFAELARRGGPYQLFFEITACLDRAAVETLRAGGMTWMQPGIESLSTGVLRLAHKGHDAWRNVQLLKWCRQYGVRVTWNLLFGLPGEQDAWHAAAARLVPALLHLNPPRLVHRVAPCRNSAYYERAAELGVAVTPSPDYATFLPFASEDLAELAFTLESSSAAWDAGLHAGLEALAAAVREWQRRSRMRPAPELVVTDDGRALVVHDTRSVEVDHELTGVTRLALLLADEAPRRAALIAALVKDHPPEDVEAAVATLLSLRLAVAIDGRIVGLPLRAPLPGLPRDREMPEGHVDRGMWRDAEALLGPDRDRPARA